MVISFKNQGTKYSQAEWQNFTHIQGLVRALKMEE
jgi:hypothetical protein